MVDTDLYLGMWSTHTPTAIFPCLYSIRTIWNYSIIFNLIVETFIFKIPIVDKSYLPWQRMTTDSFQRGQGFYLLEFMHHTPPFLANRCCFLIRGASHLCTHFPCIFPFKVMVTPSVYLSFMLLFWISNLLWRSIYILLNSFVLLQQNTPDSE